MSTTFDVTALREALLNVTPHTERNGMPVLGAVRLESDGSTLTMITTDRHVMAVDTVSAVEAGEPFTFTLDSADATKIAGMCKGAPRNVAHWPITFALDNDRLTVATYDQTATCRAVDGEFPRWHSIFTGAQESATDNANGAAHVAYNPQLLAKFAKVTVNGRKANVIKIHLTAPVKPAFVEIGETFRAVIMPCRVDWDEAPVGALRVAV